MAPRPYSEKSPLTNDSPNESMAGTPNPLPPETPSSLSSTPPTTPSPTPHDEVTIEPFVDNVLLPQEINRIPDFGGMTPCYPTPGDIMPYDHSLPDFIRQITNEENLSNVESLSLRVISTLISVHRMSSYLPNLRELDLEGSVLNSLRDIGCNLKNLQILKVGRCQLESLDGTFGLSSLRELYAQKNFINDVSPCSNLPHIRHIDVSGNRIRNISYAGFLSVCTKLKSIIFKGNPATELSDYRRHVRRILPQLESLDGVSFNSEHESKESKESKELKDSKESKVTENSCEGSDSSSTGIPDFSSVSPSDSLNNFFDSEEDFSALDKKNKHAKNLANQDQFESNDFDNLNNDLELENEFKNKVKNEFLDQSKIVENRNTNIKQKCTSIQKLDKDIENRNKKSHFLLNSNFSQDFVHSEHSRGEVGGVEEEEEVEGEEEEVEREEREEREEGENEDFRKFQKEKISERNASGDANPQEIKSGAIRRRQVFSVGKFTDETLGGSKLSSGLPVCGNLTVALRNRKKIKNDWEEKQKIFEKEKEIKENIEKVGKSWEADEEKTLFDENLLETSRKWREEFRRFRSNTKWELEEEEEKKEEKNSTKETLETSRE